MQSLAQEIEGFSRSRLRKQRTRVTTVTGRRLLESRSDSIGEDQGEELEEGEGCGFVEDKSLDLQVGVVRPFLLLGKIGVTIFEKIYYLSGMTLIIIINVVFTSVFHLVSHGLLRIISNSSNE